MEMIPAEVVWSGGTQIYLTCFEGETTRFVDGLEPGYRIKTVKVTPKQLNISLTKTERTTGRTGWERRKLRLGFWARMSEMLIRHPCGNVE